jgi:hypothetical protein
MTDHPTLEHRLREAADATVWADVSPDAWQQNERRVAADLRRRHVRRLQVTGIAAAAAVVVALGTVALPRLTGSDAPAATTNGSTAKTQAARDAATAQAARDAAEAQVRALSGNGLKGGVEMLRLRHAKGTLSVQLALQPGKGGFVDLCEALVTAGDDGTGGGSTGCGGGGPEGGPAKGTHVAYLTGSNGGGVDLVAGTVDPQVDKVRGWTRDGRPLDANLLALNRGSYRGFAFLSLKAADRPVLIAALGPNEHILEVIDVRQRFDPEMCQAPVAGQPPATSVAVSGVRVNVASSVVSVWVPRSDGAYDAACLRAAVPFPALQVGSRVIALLPPDVSPYEIRLETRQGKRLGTVESTPLAGTAWRIAVFDLAGASSTGAQVVLRQPLGGVAGRAAVAVEQRVTAPGG